jgi:hypothetical protein
MAKLVDEGENRIANVLFASQSVDTVYYLGLYTNASEPAESATLTDMTELTGAGYARKTLTRGSFSVTGSIATYAEQTFTASGGNWSGITGYFIGNSADDSGQLLWVESFSEGSFNINDGSAINITPKIEVK